MTSRLPYAAKSEASIVRMAPVYAMSPNTLTSIIGSDERSSKRTNTTRTATERTSEPTMRGEPKPYWGASTRAKVTAPTPTMNMSWPTMSKLWRVDDADSDTNA